MRGFPEWGQPQRGRGSTLLRLFCCVAYHLLGNQSEARVCMCLEIIINSCVAIAVREVGSNPMSLVHSFTSVIQSGAYTWTSMRTFPFKCLICETEYGI